MDAYIIRSECFSELAGKARYIAIVWISVSIKYGVVDEICLTGPRCCNKRLRTSREMGFRYHKNLVRHL